MYNNYCPLIFHGIYVERSFSHNLISPCCLAKKKQIIHGQIDFLKNTSLNKLRDENKNNIRSIECNACWNLEDAGGESKRQVTIDQYKRKKIPMNMEPILYSIDYNTLPICNAKCIICSPQYSSTWAAAKGKNLKNILIENKNHLEGLNLDNIKTIYFNGGEPLLTNEHYMFLEKVKNIEDVDLMYNTNGSCYPNNEVLSIWARAKNVKLFFSIDGIEEKFETIRTPLKWNVVSSNIKKIHENYNFEVHCSFTLGNHNVYDLDSTISWFKNLTNFDVKSRFHVHCVNTGHTLSFQKTSYSDKIKFIQEIKKFKNYYWYTSVINSIK